ncbi:MAG: protoheme IX farnesyltransferase [Bacteroidetes bacterium]|nr:protoheme IX farnesyltransferase [Bacteroidota bacterium]
MNGIAEQTAIIPSGLRGIIRAFYELTKPGITYMVLASMAIGFLLGSTTPISLLTLLHAAIGTFMIAGGTAAHNQYMERSLDKLMIRTAKRPLPMHKISDTQALAFSLTMIFGGLLYLIITVNFIAGMVSLATSFIYLVLYTPLKQVSFWNVPIGSVAGALPPVGGWAAASGTIADPGVWILFLIVFLWQVPHVLAIAWLCNEDYTRAGFRMLPKGDKNGTVTSVISFICLVALIPVILSLYYLDLNTIWYVIPATLATIWFVFQGVRFMYERTQVTARKLMFASFFYLPIVWILILIDKLVF